MLKVKSRIKDVAWNIGTKTSTVTLSSEIRPKDLADLLEKDLNVGFEEYDERQSDQMRKYYWELIPKLARKHKLKNSEVHNMMLRDYSEVFMFDNSPVVVEIPDTEEAEKQSLRDEKVHLLPTSEVRVYDDATYRVYFLLKGSHQLTKKQYVRLLEGLIEECKAAGISTETPEEIARIKALWSQ